MIVENNNNLTHKIVSSVIGDSFIHPINQKNPENSVQTMTIVESKRTFLRCCLMQITCPSLQLINNGHKTPISFVLWQRKRQLYWRKVK